MYKSNTQTFYSVQYSFFILQNSKLLMLKFVDMLIEHCDTDGMRLCYTDTGESLQVISNTVYHKICFNDYVSPLSYYLYSLLFIYLFIYNIYLYYKRKIMLHRLKSQD